MRNLCRTLDELSLRALGIYVYGLSDPLSRRIFYVGKGGGKFEDGSGNLRVFSHFKEADIVLQWVARDPDFQTGAKYKAIASVWDRGDDVVVSFYRRRLRDESEAFHVEAALIAALAGSAHGDTDNANAGMHLHDHGAISLADAVDFGAPKVNPITACRVLLFNITTSLSRRPKRAREDVYECTRFAWSGLAIPEIDVIAVGYAANISRGGFASPLWHKEADGRLSFTAEFSDWLPEDHPLIGRNLTNILSLVPWRKWNGAIGVEFDGAGRFRIFRGAPAGIADQSHPCVD